MNRRWVVPIIVAIIFVGLILAVALSQRSIRQIIIFPSSPTSTPFPTSTPIPTITPTLTPTFTPTPTTLTPTPMISDLINVTNPSSNQIVSSPLTISGRARGPWFFEAQAPVQLLDGNSQVIAQGSITAQGDWQTNNFVPFTEVLNFSTPSTSRGQLILRNANPSDLAQNSRQLTVPIRFR